MAHTFDTNLRFSGATNPLTSNYTPGSGATLLVLGIVVGGAVQRSGNPPTYNGVEFTQAGSTQQFAVNPETSCEMWYLLDPPTGSALEISVPNPLSLPVHVQASSYAAASGFSSKFFGQSGETGTSASPSPRFGVEAGGVVVSVLGSGENFLPTANSATALNSTLNGLYSDNNQFFLSPILQGTSFSWTTQTYGAGVYGGGVYNGDDDWCSVVAVFSQGSTDATPEPDVFALSLSLLAPSIVTGGNISVFPTVLALTATLNAPVVSIDGTFEDTLQTLSLTLPAPTVSIDVTVEPSALTLAATLLVNSIQIEQDVTVGVPALTLTLTIGQHNVLAPLDIVRMMPFIFSTSIAYPVEFGQEYARFYFDGAPLLGAGEVHVEISTPYQSDELNQIQTEQSADVMWMVHRSHPQAKLSRTTPTTFTLEDIVFKKGPFIERNDLAEDDGVTMNVNVTGTDEAGILTRSSGIFETGHIGALFKLTHPRVNRQTNGVKVNSEIGIIGEVIEVLGDYTFSVTTSNYVGTVRLQRSTNDFASSTNVKVFTNQKGTFSATETTENVQYRMVVGTDHTSGKISASLLVNTNSVKGNATSVGVIGVPLDIKGSFNFNTHGNWDATVVIERNENDAGWEPFRTYKSDITNGVGDRNVQFEGIEQEDNVRFRMNVTEYESGTVKADLAATSSTQSGIVRINGILTNETAEITVVSKVSQTTDTKRWAEGEWSTLRGFPSAVTFFEERVVYGFTDSNSQGIWISETGKFEDFEAGINDADSFALRLPTANRGRWLASLGTLAAGTAGDEWRIKAPLDESLTPKNFDLKKQTAYGGADIQVIEIGSVILFVDFVGRKVREFTFRDADQKYVAPDLTSLAEHITLSGIVSFAHQKNPDSILWCVLENGNLITMTYERDQNVVAWATMPTDGLVQSVMVIPAPLEDEVWISIVRAIDGETKVYIEQMQPRTLDIRKENAFFVDSGIIYTGPATNTITDLGHLEGKIVKILADGVVLDPQRVVDGKIILATQASNVRAGLGYDSKLTPMRMDVTTRGGTTHGSTTKTPEYVISFLDTVGAKYGDSDTTLFDIDFDEVGLKNTSKIEGLFTGDVRVHGASGFTTDNPLIISQSDPLPCTVRAIISRTEKTSR